MYQIKVHQVPEGSRQAKGAHIANLLPMEKGESIATALTLREFTDDHYFLFVTRRGMVKRSELSLFRNCRSTGIRALSLREKDELIMVRVVDDSSDVILATRKGQAIRFNCIDIRSMGRTASGVKGIALRSGDVVVGGVVTGEALRSELLTVAELGFGKRTQVDQYRLQSRGGKGIINMRVTPKTGEVLGVVMVNDQDEVVLLTTTNKIIRLSVAEISLVGRATQGVRLVKMDNGGRVAGFDLVPDNSL
jgi:DNA gyrase subunit A